MCVCVKISCVPQIKEEVDSTELAMAFCLSDGASSSSTDVPLQPRQQSVFAFLPLRSFGFRFIIQGQGSRRRAKFAEVICALHRHEQADEHVSTAVCAAGHMESSSTFTEPLMQSIYPWLLILLRMNRKTQ